jgi:hypothetical protein
VLLLLDSLIIYGGFCGKHQDGRGRFGIIMCQLHTWF